MYSNKLVTIFNFYNFSKWQNTLKYTIYDTFMHIVNNRILNKIINLKLLFQY